MKVRNLNNHMEHIISGYQQQCLLYQQLLQISQQFSQQLLLQTCAQSDDGVDLLTELSAQIMQKRTDIVENIKELDDIISSHKEAMISLLDLKEFNLENMHNLIQPNLRQEFNEQVTILRNVIKTIIDTDNKSEAALIALKQNISKKLKNISQHFEIQQAYLDRPERFPEPRFLDKIK